MAKALSILLLVISLFILVGGIRFGWEFRMGGPDSDGITESMGFHNFVESIESTLLYASPFALGSFVLYRKARKEMKLADQFGRRTVVKRAEQA